MNDDRGRSAGSSGTDSPPADTPFPADRFDLFCLERTALLSCVVVPLGILVLWPAFLWLCRSLALDAAAVEVGFCGLVALVLGYTLRFGRSWVRRRFASSNVEVRLGSGSLDLDPGGGAARSIPWSDIHHVLQRGKVFQLRTRSEEHRIDLRVYSRAAQLAAALEVRFPARVVEPLPPWWEVLKFKDFRSVLLFCSAMFGFVLVFVGIRELLRFVSSR